MDESLLKLIEWIETASPVIWTAAQRQVEVNVIEAWIGFWVAVIFGVILLTLSIWCTVQSDDSYFGWVVGIGFTWPLTIMVLIAAIAIRIWLLKVAMNPIWYQILQVRQLMPR